MGSGSSSFGNFGAGFIVFELIIIILSIIVMWKVYEKAEYPGVASIIPFYNLYILFKIADLNGWMMLLLFVPVINFIVIVILYMRIAAGFGKDGGFAIGLILLSIIFFPILAFGEADYDVSRIK